MKNSKSNYLKVAALMLLTIAVSCKKDTTTSLTPAYTNPADAQQEMAPEPAVEGADERNTGAILLPTIEYNKLQKADVAITVSARPSTYFLSCPPIKNQGSEGSCVAFASAYAARSIARLYKTGATTYSNSTNVFSPEFIYNQTKSGASCSSGSLITAALNKMNYWSWGGVGVCTWNSMPYSSSNGCSTQPNQSQINNANIYFISGYGTVGCNYDAIKDQLLQNRAVIIGGPVDTEFQNLGNNQVYTQYHSNHFVGNHSYTVVGYSDAKGAFLVMNSWGTNWGTNGYGWIAYSAISGGWPLYPSTGLFAQAYVITSSN